MTDRELMRQAVVALDLAMLHGEYPKDTDIFREISNTANALSARLAQPEPEPCAACSGRGWYTCGASDMRLKCPECKGKKAAPPKRVYCSCGDGIVPDDGALCGICVSLKKMREWQGLTDEDVGTVSDEFLEGALWAEAKLKEKNA